MSQNWLITGAGRGFGRAFVSAAAESGAEVYAGVRHVPEGDPLFHSPRVHPLIFDVTKPGEVNAAVEKALGEAGHIDVLINNAGFGMSGAFEEMSDEELRGLMEADYYGVVNVTRAILPSMRGRRGGTILNVASQGGLMGFTGSSAYCSAKFAVVGLARPCAWNCRNSASAFLSSAPDPSEPISAKKAPCAIRPKRWTPTTERPCAGRPGFSPKTLTVRRAIPGKRPALS